MKNPISLILLLGFTLVRVASASTYADDFPAALSNYVYGGWQGPFGDGTAGRLFPTADSTGIYMDATYNGYVWALRSSPEFSDADMTVRFVLPNRDNTEADWFGLWMLAHNPTTPPGGSCTTVCPFIVPESGLWLLFRVGFNQLVVTRFAGGVAVSSTTVPLPLVALNQPHDARAVYHNGSLIVYLDSVQLLNWPAPDVPAGQVGFEVYRTDMIVDATNVVAAPDFAPTLAQPANMTVDEGATADQAITGTDPDGDALTFSKVAGPAYMTVTTVTPGTGTGTGNIHLAPGFLDAGTAQATVRASDGSLSDEKSLTITVNNVPGPPTLAAIANMSVAAGATADQGISATDPDGDAITFTSSGPAFMTITSNTQVGNTRTGNIHLAPPLGTTGTFPASVTATANTQTASQSFTVTARENQPPAITAPATASGGEGCSIATMTATATDPDASNTLTITQTGKPASLTFTGQAPGPSPRTATITGTPGFGSAGTYSVEWTVNDGTGATNATASTTTVLTISPNCPNRQPAITAPATASGGENAPISTITATATDADGTNFLTITQAGKPASLTFTAQTPGPSPRTATITGTPAFGTLGTYSIVWTVNDGAGGTASATTVLTICQCQSRPAITAPAIANGAEGTPIATITATATDADASNNLTITQAGKPVSLTFTAQAAGPSPRTATITGTPAFGIAGAYSIVWTVNDGTGTTNATASTTTVLTIANTNQRPAIAAPATASAPEGAPITPITATATDADASNNLTITQSGKPASLTFTAQAPGPSPRTATISGTTTFTDAGTYSIVWTVNDGTGATNATASTTTVLNVGGPNRSPAITAPATASGTEGSPIATMIATATDADATDNLTITQAGKPVSLTFTAQAAGPSPRTAQITGTPAFGIAGTYSIVWTVNDGTGVINGTASTTTVLTIASGQNRCPVANPDGPYSGITGAPISFNGSGSFDPDGDPLTYAWDFGDGSTASGPTPVHAYLVGGNFAVALTVTDNGHGDPTQVCIGTAATTAAIMPACPATVFNGYDVIKLATGKPTWFAFVQPAGGCYANTDVVTSSFVLKYAGNQIPADARRTSVGGDRSGDGIEEIRVTFTKADLRTLFAGLPNGHNMVEVTIGANLATPLPFSTSTRS